MNHAGERTVSRPKNDEHENPIIKFVFSSPHMTGSNQFQNQYGPQIDQIKIVNRKTTCCVARGHAPAQGQAQPWPAAALPLPLALAGDLYLDIIIIIE
jgi:hypothetical protein